MKGPVGRWFVQLSLAAMGTWGLIHLISYGAVRVFGWPGWWWHVPYVMDSHGINGTGVVVGIIIFVVWATADLMWPQHLVAKVFSPDFLLANDCYVFDSIVGRGAIGPVGCLASLSRVGVG